MAEATSLRAWLEGNPPAAERYTQTLAGVAERIVQGEDPRHAVREFLDEYALRVSPQLRQVAVDAEPRPSGDPRWDAYLAALAEHLSVRDGFAPPAWTVGPARFLDRMWFVVERRAFFPSALRDAPASFRRRGVFITAGALERV